MIKVKNLYTQEIENLHQLPDLISRSSRIIGSFRCENNYRNTWIIYSDDGVGETLSATGVCEWIKSLPQFPSPAILDCSAYFYDIFRVEIFTHFSPGTKIYRGGILTKTGNRDDALMKNRQNRRSEMIRFMRLRIDELSWRENNLDPISIIESQYGKLPKIPSIRSWLKKEIDFTTCCTNRKMVTREKNEKN